MALQSLRLRRAVSSLLYLHRSLPSPIVTPMTPPVSTVTQSPITISKLQPFSFFQSRCFTGSPISLMSAGKRELKLWKEGEEITEDTILFEGCDFEHWLITMDFDKENKPSPEEMVSTYEKTCAEGLGISIEEAKRRIYACSTTTYQGFQAVMTEEESKKFEGLPGVVFVLPDSYIDPVNKEYGGDKYENGVITHRPPPVQYRKAGSRDRNRNPGREQRYDPQRGAMPNQQGSPQYGQRGPMQGGGWNSGPSQNYPPQQNYGPPGQGERMPMNNRDYASGGRDAYQPSGAGYMPQHQGNNLGQPGNHYSPEQRGFPQENQRQYGSSGQFGENRNYAPSPAGNYGKPPISGYGQGANPGYGQGANPGYGQGVNPGYGQGVNPGYGQGANPGHGHGSNPGYGQGANPGHGHGSNPGYGQGANPSYGQAYPNYGQGGSTGYGQGHPSHSERISQVDQQNTKGDQGNYGPTMQPAQNQGRN